MLELNAAAPISAAPRWMQARIAEFDIRLGSGAVCQQRVETVVNDESTELVAVDQNDLLAGIVGGSVADCRTSSSKLAVVTTIPGSTSAIASRS